MSARKKLFTLSRLLGKMPSMGYALVYLSFIPIFALVYYSLTSQFYHSTIQYENETYDKHIEIRDRIGNEIFRQYADINPPKGESSTWAPANGWFINPRRFGNLKVGETQATFDVLVFANHFPDGVQPNSVMLPTSPTFPIRLTIELWDIGKKAVDPEGRATEEKHLSVEFETQNPLLKNPETQLAIIRALFPKMTAVPYDLVWLMPADIMEDLRVYRVANQGLGSAMKGNFVRMLYLSASTLTTLGFGDIVPITSTARLLVSVEGILGIVLIGLFLNALSFERARIAEDEAK